MGLCTRCSVSVLFFSRATNYFDIKNASYTGNNQTCINEAQKLQPSDPWLSTDTDVLMYRAYLALKKFRVVLEEVGPSSKPLLKPLTMLAAFLSNPSRKGAVVPTWTPSCLAMLISRIMSRYIIELIENHYHPLQTKYLMVSSIAPCGGHNIPGCGSARVCAASVPPL